MKSSTRRRSGYFFWMSVLLLAFVIVGFAPTFFLRPLSNQAGLPAHLVVHGTILTTWFVWLVVQTSAIRTGRIATHRKLGVAGVCVAAACVVGGPLATLGSVRSLRARGLDWNTDMSAYPPLGIEGVPMEKFAAQLVFGNFASVAIFAGLLIAAVLLRRNAVSHKRLMVLASIALIGPALARISRWPGLGGEDSAFIPLVFFGLIASLFAHDWITGRRIERATWIGFLVIVLTFVAVMAASSTPFATTIVRGLA